MSFLKFFSPQQYKFPDSRYNKNISVIQYLNSTTLAVDGLIESGDIMTRVWKKGIIDLLPSSFIPENVLLLGLAGGSNARLIKKYFPHSHITAIEIDPFMAELGNKYFGLGKIKNLQVVIADALNYINNLKKADQFDLILVDCFIGKVIPKKLEDLEFIKKLKAHGRYVLINRLWWRADKIITANFFRIISPHLFFTKTCSRSNVVISLV